MSPGCAFTTTSRSTWSPCGTAWSSSPSSTRPRRREEELPILLYRTPYSIGPYGPHEYRDVLGPSPEFDRDGYIFAFQDVRGKFKSEGEFAVIRPLAPKPKGATDTDESTDNFDTIEWLLANIEGHNGRVGQWGISYSGWQTLMGMVDAHAALVADFADPIPSIFMAELFNISAEDRDEFFKWSIDLAAFFGPPLGDIKEKARLANEGTRKLEEYFLHLITLRRQKPAKTL